MSIPKYHEFMKPVLSLLGDTIPHNRTDLYEKLSTQFQLSEEEKAEWLPSGKQLVYKNRIGWALMYLKKANLIDSPTRATYLITELGKAVLEENPKEINQNYLKRFEGFTSFIKSIVSAEGKSEEIVTASSGESPRDTLDRAYKGITSTLVDDVLNEVMTQSPDFFEKLVVDLLVSMGYGGSKIENSQVFGKSGERY